jgi:hypothetical protein
MQAFLVEWLSDFRTRVPLAAWLAISLIGGIAGPFGTYELLPLPARLAFWAAVVGVTIVLGSALRALVFTLTGLRGFWPGAVVVACLCTAIFPLPLAVVAQVMFADAPSLRPETIEIALFVFFASVSMGAFRHSFTLADRPVPLSPARVGASAPAVGPDAAGSPQPAVADHAVAESVAVAIDGAVRVADADRLPRLVQRLEPALQTALVSVSVRDHYVEVVTRTGRSNLLMRLSDAIRETEGVDGMQVHRSHWVARSAVRGLCRDRGRAHLLLTDGSVLPVSRNHRAGLDIWAVPDIAAHGVEGAAPPGKKLYPKA